MKLITIINHYKLTREIHKELVTKNKLFFPTPTSSSRIDIYSYLCIDEINDLAIDIEDNIR